MSGCLEATSVWLEERAHLPSHACRSLLPLPPAQLVLSGLLRLGGRYYWPVNALLMLLKLLDEHYLGLLPSTISNTGFGAATAAPPGGRPRLPSAAAAGGLLLPGQQGFIGGGSGLSGGGGGGGGHSAALSTLGPDVAQRCLELLRTFNTVTAQQVCVC